VDDQHIGQIPKLLQIEMIHYNEMNGAIFDIDIDIDMNVWDNARNVIEPILFHRFHGQSNQLAYTLWHSMSFIEEHMLLTY
jgi:hypothetical protein